ncbi:MAG TPA: hypothetical protein PKM48_14680 [Parvularculaceae bacterium]|nr:hypothetical protein [Parvularculaceae bacterium]
MLKLVSAAALFAAGLFGAVAANETADACRAYVAENGGDDTGCDCLGAAAEDDADLADALAAIETPDDLDAADDATKEAIAACFPA